MQELQAILTLYIGTLLGGYSVGFSAVAIPDIKRTGDNSTNFLIDIPEIQASGEELSWFGRCQCNLSFSYNCSFLKQAV